MNKIRQTLFLIIIILFSNILTYHAFCDLADDIDLQMSNVFEIIVTAEREGANIKELIDELKTANELFEKIITCLIGGSNILNVLSNIGYNFS